MKYYLRLLGITLFLCSNIVTAQAQESNSSPSENLDPATAQASVSTPFQSSEPSDDLKNYLKTEDCLIYPTPETVNEKLLVTLSTGDCLVYHVPEPTQGSSPISYKLVSGLVGVHVVERTGRLTWAPTSNQVGTHSISVEVTNTDGSVKTHKLDVQVSDGGKTEPAGLFVVPGGGTDVDRADDPDMGTVSKPYNTLKFAAQQAHAQGGGTIYIRGGHYEFTARIGGVENITIRPWQGEIVTIKHPTLVSKDTPIPDTTTHDTTTIRLANSKNITIQSLELVGGSEDISFEEMMKKYFWKNERHPYGRFGIRVTGDSENVTIDGSVVHGYSQKAIDVGHLRYMTVRNNIIYATNWTSLKSGHGLMRYHPKRKNDVQGRIGDDFTLNTTLTKDNEEEYLDEIKDYRYRTDIIGNLIFDVYQRIYSWNKNLNQTLVSDEGNGIMVEDSPDLYSRTRVAHNLILGGRAYSISANSTPNLEILNNSIVKNDGGPFQTPHGLFFKGKQKEHITIKNNAVYSHAGSDSGWDNNASGYRLQRLTGFKGKPETFEIVDNYQDGGGEISGTSKLRHSVSDDVKTFTDLDADGHGRQLFKDPQGENVDNLQGFRITDDIQNETPNIYIGVSEDHLLTLEDMIERYGVEVKNSGFCDDPVWQMKLIIDSAPEWALNPAVTLDTENDNRFRFTWDLGTDAPFNSGMKQTFISPRGYVKWIAKTTLSPSEYEMWVNRITNATEDEEMDEIVEKIENFALNPTLPRDDAEFNGLMKASGCHINLAENESSAAN